MKSSGRFVFYWGPFLCFAGLIFYLSSISTFPGAPDISDKAVHLAEYSVFALLHWRALAKKRFWTVERSRTMTVFWVGAAYAASDEIHQMFVPGRNPSVYDWIADVTGILGMITLMFIGTKWMKKTVKA